MYGDGTNYWVLTVRRKQMLLSLALGIEIILAHEKPHPHDQGHS